MTEMSFARLRLIRGSITLRETRQLIMGRSKLKLTQENNGCDSFPANGEAIAVSSTHALIAQVRRPELGRTMQSDPG